MVTISRAITNRGSVRMSGNHRIVPPTLAHVAARAPAWPRIAATKKRPAWGRRGRVSGALVPAVGIGRRGNCLPLTVLAETKTFLAALGADRAILLVAATIVGRYPATADRRLDIGRRSAMADGTVHGETPFRMIIRRGDFFYMLKREAKTAALVGGRLVFRSN